MVDTTIRIGLEIDGSQAIKEFENVTTASENVLANMKKIRSESDAMMPGTDSFFDQSELAVQSSFNRIDAINKQIDNTPVFSEHQLENLKAEREMLRRGIEATVKEMQQFASSSVDFVRSFSSKKGGTSSIQAITKMMPSLMNIVRQVADFQRESDTLMDAAAFKAGIKNKIVEAGLTNQLGFAKDSKSMDHLAEYLMLKGTDQTQRKNFMAHIASGYEKKQHLSDSFAGMLPEAFKAFHASKGTLAAPEDITQITAAERRKITEMLTNNPYFMQAAEASGVGRRMNGTIEIRSGITRGMVNRLAGNLYDTIIASAKGMPMYGITDVDDPRYWDRIARKSNKPFLGSMNSARVLSDNFDWLRPTIGAGYKDTGGSYTKVIDKNGKPFAVPFSPDIKRYEVANYTLEDLQKNIDLNRDRSVMYGQQTVKGINPYISIDHSARLENIFRHRQNGVMPKNNDVVDDFLFLNLDDRLADPNLDEKTKQSLMDAYASYIDKGITKTVNGKSTHFSFTRAHKGLGLEFVQDAIFNAMAPVDPTTGERDLSAFWGGVKMPKVSVNDKHLKDGKMVNYTPEEVFELGAKFVEYASKDATSGESIESLYGTILPDNLKIGIFDLEKATQKATEDQKIAGAGMNGTSYISKKLVPGGFQARMPGIKTALNSVDFAGFLSHFGGAIKTLGPDGRIEEITPDLDLLLSMSDIKNAGIRYQDDQGNLLPTAQIADNIRQEIKNNGGKIFANKTMDDAQGGIHWMSRQFSQILGDDPEFVRMTTKAFLDEYQRVGTLEGALDTVFAGDSEMRDLILASHGAIMSDRKIQDRIQDFRTGMISRISQGDTILPRELETSRAMAQPWLFDAVITGMKKINETGTGAAETGKQTYYDTVFGKLSKEQQDTLSMITMDNNSVAYQKIMAEVLGIGRYPATSRSARTAENVLAGTSEKAKAMRAALEKSGFDPNAMYISPSSPLMTLLQDADFDGDVMDLIGLVYSGQDKNGPKLRAAEVFNEVYKRGIAKIDSMGLSQSETDARKERFTNAVFKMDKFDPLSGKDVMNIITPAKQSPYFMGGPDAVVRNAMQIPWTESVMKAIADAESQYSVNSVRNKKGLEMATTPEQMELLSKYRTFTEFFHAVNKNRDEFGNVDIPKLTEAMRGGDGLSGAKFWATNLPFHTMSSNVRTMMLSRYFAKQRGIDINEGYNWNYIFDSILGKKDEKTALGRMQSGLRDAWMGFLNADYLAIDEESIAKLAELRKLAVDEEAAKVAAERHKEGSSSYGKKGSNRSIAERLVDRLGGNVIKNAAAGMAMSESHLQDAGINKDVFELLQAMHMPDVVGGLDLSKLLAMKTTPQTFEEMSATTKSTQLARTLDMFNLLTQTEKQNRIDNMPRLSFSALAKLAYDPEEFMKDIVSGRENNSSLPATEIGQGAHTAIEHFMRTRMSGALRKDDGTVNEEGLKKAQQEALDVFDQYLGVKKAPTGFKWEGRGLTDAERADMLTPGSKLNERYERLKSFIGGNGLLSVFPEKDWEVIGIESSNVGDKGEQISKGNNSFNMKIPGKGKKILSPDKDVEMTGSYDLLFRNKKDGRVVMGDIKNYWDPTAQDWEKWKVQQAIYASQLKKNGFDDIGSTIIEPYFNRQRNIGFTDYDFIKSDENVAKAIQAIQGLAKNGDTTIRDVYDVSKFVRETLFGDVRSSVGDQIADRYNKYTRSGKRSGGALVNPGVITDALWMHDRYNEAVENDDDIHKFINKETRSRDSVYTSDMAWRSKYTQAEAIHEAAVIQEKSGRMAEAKDLDARYEAAVRDLDNNMGIALVNHITDFADNVRSSIDGQSGTKQIQDTVKAYTNTQNQQSGLEKSISLFQDRIKETQGREQALADSIEQLTQSDANIAKDEDVYDKLIQYTKEALGLTEDTKNISSKSAAGKRAARTKLLNANAHIRDSSIFAAINQALNVGDRKSEESALALMEQRKQELSNVRKDTQSEIQKKNVEKQAENLQGALMNDQLLKAQDLLNTTVPLTDIYLAQLKKSATTSLDDSLIALAGVTDKNVGKPFTTSKARTDYINMVGNNLQDAGSLLQAGMISEADFARYKAQVDTLMQEDNLSKVEQAAIDDVKRKLGMKTETPNEQREKWLKDRKQILEAERDLKKRDARRETIDAYKEARKNNQYARPIDYKTKIDEQNAKIDEQYEQDLARIEEEREYLDSQNELTRRQKLERLEYQNYTIQEQRQRAYEQQLRARWGQPRSRIVAAYRQQDGVRFGLLQSIKDNEFAAKQTKERLTNYKDNFAAKYGISYENYQSLSKKEKGNIAGDHAKDAQAIAETTQELTKYNNAANAAREQSKKFTPVMMGLSAGFQGISQTVGMLLSRFGRQMFYKAINEVKQFVKEFDKSMTSIQMITLKSDSQISQLGNGLISKAKDLKVSISDITKSAETLYRQGLTDEEVDDRLEVVSKFSKVSGTKIDAATKLVTVAMNTGLVDNAQQAADIVTALGDNAATNASEIEKGIEKAGAAAAADGTTFSELSSMLTAITSTTQIGGNVAGRTLNTIFGRMNKIGTDEIIYDENGYAVSGSAVSRLLEAQGIKTYENGKKRSSFDVLYDLSKVWDSLNDATQQQLATQIAGTRQYSNFAAIMQGMSEGKVDEYMKLAGESGGIVDEKYQIYLESLEASLTNVKNTFDDLVHDLTENGTLTGVLDFISNMIKGLDNLANSAGGLAGVLEGILPMLIALTMMKSGNLPMMLGGLALGIGAGSWLGNLGKQEKSLSSAELLQQRVENFKEVQEARTGMVDRAEELYKKGSDRTEIETSELKQLAAQLSEFTGLDIDLDSLSSSSQDAASGLDGLSDSLNGTGDVVDEFSEVVKAARQKIKDEEAHEKVSRAGDAASAISEGITQFNEEYKQSETSITNHPELFTVRHDNASGTYIVTNDVSDMSEKEIEEYATGYSDGQLGMAKVRGISDATGIDAIEYYKGINSFLRASKAADYSFLGAYGGAKDVMSVWNALRTFLGKESISFSQSDLAYAMNGKPYEENVEDYAKLFSKYTMMLGKDSGSAYAGWGVRDWKAELNRVGNGESMISTSFLNAFSDYYSRTHLDTDAYSKQKQRVKQLFRDQLSSIVEPEYLDAIVERATNEYYAATPNLDPYEMPDANNNAIAQIIQDINGTSNPYNVSADVLRHNHQTYALGQTTKETDEKLTKFITDNPVVEVANAEQEKQFNDKVREYASAAIQSTKTQTYAMPTGERITRDELPGALDMLDQFGYQIGYAYTDRKGMTYEDLDLEEANDLRYRDFVNEVIIPTAKKDKQYSRILRENRGDYQAQQDALAEWYFTNHPEHIYEDYTRPGPVLQKPIYEEDTYFVNGKTYTDAEKAYEENVDYFKELYSKENPVENVGTMYKFGDTLYDTEELAQEAQTAAFYEEQSKNAPSLFGSNVYSFAESWRSDKSSMPKASANDFIKNLQEKGITSFSALKEAVDNKSITGFTTLLSANPALAEKLKEVVSFENGEYSIKAGADENFWNEFLTTVAQASKYYADVNLVTRQSAATNALTAFNEYTQGKLLNPDTIAGHDDLKTIIGSDLYGKWTSGTLSSKEQEYVKQKIENYRTGSDITARQKAVLSAGLFKDIKEGNDLTEYTKMDDKTLSDYLSGISGVNDLYQMALALKEYREKGNIGSFTFKEAIAGVRENGKTITDEEINTVFGGRYTASDLRALNLTVSQAAELEKYKNTPQEKEISSLYSGLTSLRETERLSAVQSSMSSSDKFRRARTALERLDTSKAFEELDEAVVDELVSATGYTKDQIKKMWKSNRTGAKVTLQAQIDAQKADLYSVYSAVINSYTAGFEELKFDESVSLSTDELADILQSVEGFDKSVIAWVRTVGASVENGQYVFKEGSEQIGQTLRETTDSSKQKTENKEAALKQIEDILSGKTFEDRFYGIQSFLDQDTDVAKSISGTDLAYLLNGYGRAGTGVTEEDILTAIRNERFGINNPFIRNAYSIRRLFGSTDISRWHGATARSTYKYLDPDIRDRIDSMLGDFGDGMKQYLNGELDNWEEAIKPFAEQKYLSELGTYDKETRERIAKYKADFAYGSDSDRKAVIDYYQQGQKDILDVTDAFGKYGVIPSKKDEQAETIANFLPDWTKESVKEVLEGTDQDKKDKLAKDIQDKISDYFDELSKVLQLDIDSSDLSSSMEELTNALNNVENNASEIIKQLIEELNIDWLVPEDDKTELDRLTEEYQTSQASKSKIKDIVDKIESGDYTSLSDLYGPGKTFKDKAELSSFLETSGNSQFNERIAEINSREDQTFTEQDIAALRNSSIYGGIETNPDITAQYKEFTALMNENGGLNVDALFEKFADADFKEWASGLEWLNEALDDLEGTTDGTGEALKKLKTEALADYYDGINAFGDATKEVTDAMRQSNGTLKEQNALMEKYRKVVRSSTDATNAVKRWKDKKPSAQDKALIESLGFSKENIKQALSKDAKGIGSALYDEIMSALQNNANAEDTAENIGKGILGGDSGLNEDIVEYVRSHMGENGEITIDAPGIKVEGGTVTIDDSALLSQFSGGMSSITADLLAAATAAGGSATATVTMDGDTVNVVWSFSPGSGAGGSSRGGGGGGKSATDKLLEKQKHEIGQVTHKQKMLEEAYKGLEFNYDYAGQIANTKDQIATQKELISTYQSHISELEKMMSKTKAYSDDWWKLKEAIDSAKESIAAANNEINQLSIKDIEILVRKQENENRPKTHMQTMRETYAQTALTQDRYADYVLESEAAISELKGRVTKRKSDVEALKDELKKTPLSEKGRREELMKQIEEADEEVASLESDLATKEQDLQSQRLSHVAQVLSQNTQSATHIQSMAGTYASAYEAGGYRQQYGQMIAQQMASNDDIIKHNQTAIKDATKLMQDLEAEGKKGSTAWFEAQAAVFGYEEAIAEATTSQMELNRALQESKIEEISEQYSDATREIAHVQEMLSSFASEALERNDYGAYFTAMDKYLDSMPDKLSAARTRLASLQDQYDSGMASGVLDPTTQRKLLDEINAAETEIAEMERDQRKRLREVAQQRINQLTETQDWNKANYEHNQKKLSYQTSTYQNLGELTNYGLMIETDTNLRKDRISALEKEKDDLNALLNEEKNGNKVIEEGSDEEKRIIELIRQHDEAIASESAQIDKNNKLLEENQKKILKVRKTLEDAVDKEIEAQKKREREILSSNVSMQDTILNLLKKRLQDEWNLKKKDLEKEKESLNEYKKLINERFNYRKKAAQQADKDEEISDLERQLALLAADPTQTRQYKETAKRLEELRKERSWEIAEDQLDAENNRTDDEIEAIDKYVSYNEEKLNELLSDANNFADRLNEILSGSYEESYEKIIQFMQTENEAFMKSLPDAQKQMLQSLEDTLKKAKDILDSNYAKIKEYLYDEDGNLRSEEDVVNWFKENDREYRNYIENGDFLNAELKVREWQDAYRNVVAALKDDAIFTPDNYELGDVASLIENLDDNTYKVQVVGIDSSMTVPSLSQDGTTTVDFSSEALKAIDDLAKLYAEEKKKEPETITKQDKPKSPKARTYYVYGTKGEYRGTVQALSQAQAHELAIKKYEDPGLTISTKKYPDRGEGEALAAWSSVSQNDIETIKTDNEKKGLSAIWSSVSQSITETIKAANNAVKSLVDINKVNIIGPNAEGGLVDYTGLAWVDGSKTKPEAFLSANDTKNIRTLLDAFDYISVAPGIVPTTDMFTDNSTTIGDINVTINQAELKTGADFENVAKRVGQAFKNELQRGGFNLSGYAFS